MTPIPAPMMQIVLDVVRFFAESPDDIVDADSAVRELESIAHLLGQLSTSERAAFLDFVSRQSEEELAAHGESPTWKWLCRIAADLGLV